MIIFSRLIFIFLLSLLSFYAPFIAYLNHSPSVNIEIVDVENGESINKVLSKFTNNNLINKIFIRIFIKNNNINSIKTGEYLIKGKTIKEIILSMQNGETITHEIRINEGINIFQLEKLINESLMINDCSYLQCLNNQYPFYEGTLFPDTYFYKKNMKSSLILNQSRTKLDKFLNNLFVNEYSKNNLTKNEVLILASIIEKESGNKGELNLISSVLMNRLEKNMKLQSDVTVAFGLNMSGSELKKENLKDKNVYNTYLHFGLPPTPISYPGEESIKAALRPKKTDFLYFVSDGKGGHRFSNSYKKHKKNIKLWLKSKKNKKNETN